MEREVLLTGIGGQGVQLAANVLAHAALEEGREVQLFGSYGGMMRGGSTEATLVVADRPIEAPPTVGSAWAAVLMHPEFADATLACLRPGGLALRNASLWGGPPERADVDVVDVNATDLAVDCGSALAASMVALGALSALSGLVTIESLTVGVRACVPPYRQQHVQLNERALQAGAGAMTSGLRYEAWCARAEGSRT